jgi:acid stress chaperone HdeB
MSRLKLLGPSLAILLASAAQAQVTIDVSKITCEQLLQNKVADKRNLAIWLSGFQAGKRNDPVVDRLAVESNAERITGYCYSNPNVAVMQAIDTALRSGK